MEEEESFVDTYHSRGFRGSQVKVNGIFLHREELPTHKLMASIAIYNQFPEYSDLTICGGAGGFRVSISSPNVISQEKFENFLTEMWERGYYPSVFQTAFSTKDGDFIEYPLNLGHRYSSRIVLTASSRS